MTKKDPTVVLTTAQKRSLDFGGMNALRMTITPQIAKEWLKNYNDRNRKVNKNHVNTLIKNLQGGLWQEDRIDPCIFNVYGILDEGQHRLHAIMLSGISISCVVQFGLSLDACSVGDLDKKQKKPHERAYQEGHSSSNAGDQLGRIILSGIRLNSFEKYSKNEFTNTELKDFTIQYKAGIQFALENFKELKAYYKNSTKKTNFKRLNLVQNFAPFVKAYYLNYKKIDLQHFREVLTTGNTTDIVHDQPIVELYKYFTEIIPKMTDKAAKQGEHYATVQTSLWHYLNNKQVKIQSGGSFNRTYIPDCTDLFPWPTTQFFTKFLKKE